MNSSRKKEFVKKLLIPLFYILRIFPINNKKVMFISYGGRGYGCNCKYIAESLFKDKDIKIIWSVLEKKDNIPNNIKQIKYLSFRWMYELITSKVWINNCRMPSFVRKRNKQFYIQVWHGALMLKKIEYDAPLPISYTRAMENDNNMIDVMISNSTFNTEKFRSAFHYNGKVLEIGVPREEMLIKNKDEYTEKVKHFYDINDEKILLYAPTFRDDFSDNPYDIDFIRLKETIEKATKSKWKIFVRLHPNIKDRKDLIPQLNLVENASNYPDMQELIAACDVLITDYSSTMLESLLINKKVVLYANDIEKYSKERGYYFRFEELPFPLAQNNDELNRIFENKYDMRKYSSFYNNLGIVKDYNPIEKIHQIIIDKCIEKKGRGNNE